MAAGIRDQLGKSNYDKPSSSLLLIRAFLLGKLEGTMEPMPPAPCGRAGGPRRAAIRQEMPRIRGAPENVSGPDPGGERWVLRKNWRQKRMKNSTCSIFS